VPVSFSLALLLKVGEVETDDEVSRRGVLGAGLPRCKSVTEGGARRGTTMQVMARPFSLKSHFFISLVPLNIQREERTG
jgi:hypothetical protein